MAITIQTPKTKTNKFIPKMKVNYASLSKTIRKGTKKK